jgi:hypothetical protein
MPEPATGSISGISTHTRLAKTRRHNFFHTAQEFAWAILEKLSPPRRVLLLLGVAFLIFPAGGFSYHGKAGEVELQEFDFRFYGGAMLFILLMLEIVDRVVMKRDLEIARDIQGWLLPATPPIVPNLAIAFATRPANTVAGDFYDVFPRMVEPLGEARFSVHGLRCSRKKHSRSALDGDISGQSQDTLSDALQSYRTGRRHEPLCLLQIARMDCASPQLSSPSSLPPRGVSLTSTPAIIGRFCCEVLLKLSNTYRMGAYLWESRLTAITNQGKLSFSQATGW